MFSMTTTALSTSMPTPSISPSIVRTLRLLPSANIPPQVTRIEKGIATATIIVVEKRRRKRYRTESASTPPRCPRSSGR